MTIFNPPPIGLCVPVKVFDVHDGDTCTVSRVGSELKAPVRLLDVWAPEISIRGNAMRFEKAKQVQILEAGTRARVAFIDIVDAAKEFRFFVPFSLLDNLRITDLFTFGRMLGHLYADGKHVGQMLIDKGVAFATKAELERAGLG